MKTPNRLATTVPIHPNAGLEAIYRARLFALVEEMQTSLLYWLRSAYAANPPEMAADALPAVEMRRAMTRLARRWERHFDQAAPKLADYFAKAASERVDAQMRGILKTGGFSVGFRPTKPVRDVLAATTTENVGLIRSIAAQHLGEVEGLVMRSVSLGRDLSTLTAELEQRYGVTRRRAALIAKDQNNKATATVTRVRQTELGIIRAVWQHSHGGREPRPSHVAFSGHAYDVQRGAYLDGKWVWPGTEINCRCVSRSIIPGFSAEAA